MCTCKMWVLEKQNEISFHGKKSGYKKCFHPALAWKPNKDAKKMKSANTPQVSTCLFFSLHTCFLFVCMSMHAQIDKENSPQLCRAGTGQRRGFQWYHWRCKWWRCGPNQPASPGLSVLSFETPLTPHSVAAYTQIYTGELCQICSSQVLR